MITILIIFLISFVTFSVQESSCTYDTADLIQCLEYEIEAAEAWTCSQQKDKSCLCASCFSAAGIPCGDLNWDSHYADCLVDCGLGCYTNELSASSDFNVTLLSFPAGIFLIVVMLALFMAAIVFLLVSKFCPCRQCKSDPENAY